LDANIIVVIFLIKREEDVHALDSIPVISFCPDNQSSLLHIPHSLAVRSLNFEVGSKDGHGIIGFSFEWPDAATSLSCHLETLGFDVRFVRSSLVWYPFCNRNYG
jgi:hypothetical protein